MRGGGRKPWSKGTGRARQGSIRAPQWKTVELYLHQSQGLQLTVPKKVKRLAMKSALTSKVLNNEIIVIDEIKFDAPKTKDMVSFLNNIKADKKALIVMGEKCENVIKSARNIPNVQTTLVNTLNVYDILKYNSFIITEDAVKKVEEVYA